MKLNLENKIYESNTLLEGHDAKINPEQLKKLWEMLANPYKDNISSIVREITSNCFDSHKEAKVSDAVVITFDKDESGVFIKFSDVGTGLSPERIEKIYINYLTSSKEDSNDFIGAFGIGSKSPLSYTDMFYIDTVYEGIKYSYIMRKGDTAPRIDKIFEMPIKARNGTDIKIYIKSQNAPGSDNFFMGDVGSFAKAIVHQLAFFDNVYVQVGDKLGYLPKLREIVNNLNKFTIYEGEHYIHRTNGSALLTICLGKVSYPIDYKIVFPELTKQFPLPIALKFNIGDLMVTYSREDIKYTQEVVDKIREKFKLAVKEILDKMESNWSTPREYTDIFEYWNKRHHFSQNYFNVYFNTNYSFNIDSFMNENYWFDQSKSKIVYDYSDRDGIKSNLSYKLDNYNKPDILLSPFNKDLGKYVDSFVLKIPYFSPFKDHYFEVKQTVNFYNFAIVKKKGRHNAVFSLVKNNSVRNATTNALRDFIGSPDKAFLVNYDTENTFVFGKRFTTYVDEVLKKKTVDQFAIEHTKKLSNYKVMIACTDLVYRDKSKWRDFIKLLQTYIEEPILKKMTSLKSIESKATPEWYAKYKKDNGLTTVRNVVKKDPSTICYKTYSIYNTTRFDQYYNKIETSGFTSLFVDKKVSELSGAKNNIYFVKEDLDKVFNIMNILKKRGILIKIPSNESFCLVSKVNEKILIKNNLMYTLDDYIKDNKKDLIQLYFYTKYIGNSSLIDLKNYRNKIGDEEGHKKALVLYYLMGNDLLTPLLKQDQVITELVRTYDAFKNAQYKVGDIHDLYKKLIEEVFSKSTINFEAECKVVEQTYKDNLKNWKDDLDSHYKYLSLIYTHTSDSTLEKDSLAFFYNKIDLLDELKVIKPNSFFSEVCNTSPSPLDFRIKEKYEKDTILKQFCDSKNINKQWLWGPMSTYSQTDRKFKDYLLFYLQQYILYKKK